MAESGDTVRHLKAFLVVFVPIIVGMLLFGAAGSYVEAVFTLGLEAASECIKTRWYFCVPPGTPANRFAIGPTMGAISGVVIGARFSNSVLVSRLGWSSQYDIRKLLRK